MHLVYFIHIHFIGYWVRKNKVLDLLYDFLLSY